MAVIKNKMIMKCLLMMVVSLLLVLNFSIGVSASSGYDKQEADAFLTISERLSVKTSYGKSSKILWGEWNDYEHISMNGKEYAKVGDRLYTRHAVARMQPSGMSYSGEAAGGRVRASRIIGVGELDYGRSISPNYIEDVINTGSKITNTVDGVERTLYTSGSVKVVTEQNGKLIVTIITQ